MFVMEFTRFTCRFDDLFRKSWNWSRTRSPSVSRHSQNTGFISYIYMLYNISHIIWAIYWTRWSYSLSSDLFAICDECTSSELGLNGVISSSIFAFLTGCIRSSLLRDTKPPWHEDFIEMLRKTESLGAVTILYGLIVMKKNSTNPTQGIILNAKAEGTSMLVLQALNFCSLMDLEMVQTQLSSTDMTSQFRSVIQCLLTSNVPTNIKHEGTDQLILRTVTPITWPQLEVLKLNHYKLYWLYVISFKVIRWIKNELVKGSNPLYFNNYACYLLIIIPVRATYHNFCTFP